MYEQPIKMPLALINSIWPCWVPKHEHILRFYENGPLILTPTLRAHQLQNWSFITHNTTFG
jgi:hypothetical protein